MSNKNKATHTGECQCCGRQQKLPGGSLSTHGYTKEHGFFQGICIGAGHLPFEQSKDLVERCIANAGKEIDARNAHKLEVAKLHEQTLGYVRHYSYGYTSTIKAKIVQTDTHSFCYETSDGKRNRIVQYSSDYPKSAEECAKFCNARYSKEIDREIASVRTYIKWQQARAENWTPKALTPIK